MGQQPSTTTSATFSAPKKKSVKSTISSTFSRHKQTDGDHSQSTTAVQFQKDLRNHQREEEEFEYLTKLTTFDSPTLRLLKRRFDHIDQTIQKDGHIDIQEFAQVLAMDANSILLRRFFKFMDKSSMGSLNFRNFVTALSLLSLEAPDEDKIKLSFFLYDINDDNTIDRQECTQMVKLALDEINMKLSNEQIEVIVNNTFREADTNDDGVIDFEEYTQYCKRNPRVLEAFRIDIANLVLDEQENRRRRKVSQQKSLRHWPTDQKKKSQVLRKFKKSMPNYMKREKIEKVRSIHNALDILDGDDKDSAFWNEKSGQLPALEESERSGKGRKGKRGRMHNPMRGLRASRSMDGEDEYSSSGDEDDQVAGLKGIGKARPLKQHFSADNADRRRKKEIKYRKHKHQYTKSLDDDEKAGGAMAKKQSEADELSGLNTSVPRTPPKKTERPQLKQSDLDSIARLLN